MPSNALRWFAVLLLGLFGLLPAARAQTVPVPSASPWMIDASSGWKVHPGDDPAYAQPNFDDSGWSAVRVPSTQMEGNRRWYRARLKLPPGVGRIDLLLQVPADAVEVYVDGSRVSPPLRSSWFWRIPVLTAYRLPATSGKSSGGVEVAVRSRMYAQEFDFYPDLMAAGLSSPSGASLLVFADRERSFNQEEAGIWIMGLTVAFGLFLLGLFFVQRTQREYLWLALTLLFQGFANGLEFLDHTGMVPIWLNAAWGDPCTYFLVAAELEFVYVFAHQRPGRAIRCAQAVLVATPFVLNPLLWFAVLPNGTLEIVEILMLVATSTVLASVLIAWTRRGSREAAVLLFPILLANGGMVVLDIFYIPGILGSISLIRYQTFAVTIGQALFLVSIAIVLLYRFQQVSRKEANAAAEFEAARAVQQILIPEVLPTVAGYSIDSVYQPAQQVGGDFFQIIPAPGDTGSALVVLGDVSGKGMPAAMTVSVLVGAIRTLAEYTCSPAELLAGLNRRLLGRGPGFATCLVLHVSGGRVLAANAGHLNPYLGGEEVIIAPGLPLGLAAEAEYAEISFTLLPGQSLTLLTDGVPEATNPVTRALLGFERTAQLSTGTAASIASAASEFGAPAAPTDDITVLTLALA